MTSAKSRYCYPHKSGVPNNMRPWFVPGCPTCEDKLAAGLVRADAGPPEIRYANSKANLWPYYGKGNRPKRKVAG